MKQIYLKSTIDYMYQFNPVLATLIMSHCVKKETKDGIKYYEQIKEFENNGE